MTQNVTLDRWMNLPAEFVVEKVRTSFEVLTGERLPESKGKSKNDEAITPHQWFVQQAFLHAHILHFSFHAAEARGLLNKVESDLCREVLAILSEG